MLLDVKIRNTRSYLVEIASAKAGVSAIEMMFDLLKESAFDFSVGTIDNIGSLNSWAIEKLDDMFSLQFICLTSTNGFKYGDGSIYGYKVGHDPQHVDWPSVEFATIPRHCLLTKDEIAGPLRQLFTSVDPEQTAGFTFNETVWERLC